MSPFYLAKLLAKHAPELSEVLDRKGTSPFSKLLQLCYAMRVAPRKVTRLTETAAGGRFWLEKDVLM
jgi:hypothetical protein